MLDVLMRFLRPGGQYAARDAWQTAQRLAAADDRLDQTFPPSMDDEDAYILLILTALRMRMRGMSPTRAMRVFAEVYDLPYAIIPRSDEREPGDTPEPSTPDTAPADDPETTRDLEEHMREIPDGCRCTWQNGTIVEQHPECPVHVAKTH